MKAIFRGVVQGSNLLMHADYLLHIQTLEGQEIDLTIEKHRKKRTDSQNNLYWKMLQIIEEDTGHSKDDLHEFFKRKFLGDKIEVLGEPFVISRSTTKLNTKTFSTYLLDIRFFIKDAADIDLPIE